MLVRYNNVIRAPMWDDLEVHKFFTHNLGICIGLLSDYYESGGGCMSNYENDFWVTYFFLWFEI